MPHPSIKSQTLAVLSPSSSHLSLLSILSPSGLAQVLLVAQGKMLQEPSGSCVPLGCEVNDTSWSIAVHNLPNYS